MANKTNLLALATFIQGNDDLHFDMLDYDDCISGFAHKLFGIPGDLTHNTADVLGLEENERQSLFFPTGCYRISREQAVTTLRHFAETGVIDFTIPSSPDPGSLYELV